jgi:aryl-alcohol dehydrogenase-like predicted oxidoreductase
MKYRKLGDSDLEVSEISLGSWLTYGVGVEAEKARGCLEEAFNQGINFIDTANIYGRGAAESFLGKALKGRGRDSYVLATKLYFPMTSTDRGLSREQVEKQLDASLKRLETDYVDLDSVRREVAEARRLCNLHGWPVIDVSRRSIEETAAAIIQLLPRHRGDEESLVEANLT